MTVNEVSYRPAHGEDAIIVTDEMRTATISVCISCIDARNTLEEIIDKHK